MTPRNRANFDKDQVRQWYKTQVATEHFLLVDAGRISGCHCGLIADESDSGYGDSLVEHIALIAAGRAVSSAAEALDGHANWAYPYLVEMREWLHERSRIIRSAIKHPEADGKTCENCGASWMVSVNFCPICGERTPTPGLPVAETKDACWESLSDLIYRAMPWEGETYQAAAESIAAAVINDGRGRRA